MVFRCELLVWGRTSGIDNVGRFKDKSVSQQKSSPWGKNRATFKKKKKIKRPYGFQDLAEPRLESQEHQELPRDLEQAIEPLWASVPSSICGDNGIYHSRLGWRSNTMAYVMLGIWTIQSISPWSYVHARPNRIDALPVQRYHLPKVLSLFPSFAGL